MNLILLDGPALKQKLPASDRRSIHIRDVLAGGTQELFVGCLNGPMGKARVAVEASGSVLLDIRWFETTSIASEKAPALTLLIPFCRPQTCRKILREAASLGLGHLIFFRSGKAERGYAESSLWRSGEWQHQLHAGVEQAFTTRVPEVVALEGELEDALAWIDLKGDEAPGGVRIALDNYESQAALGAERVSTHHNLLAIGPERGWSKEERDLLRSSCFRLAHMGHRVMRTETAVVAACSVVAQLSGAWTDDTRSVLEPS